MGRGRELLLVRGAVGHIVGWVQVHGSREVQEELLQKEGRSSKVVLAGRGHGVGEYFRESSGCVQCRVGVVNHSVPLTLESHLHCPRWRNIFCDLVSTPGRLEAAG